MTTQPQRIRIISERVVETSPRPGQTLRRVAITYQLPPRPPNVLFLNADDLPDLVWVRGHPPTQPVPEAIQKQADEVRRQRILENERTRRSTGVRTI